MYPWQPHARAGRRTPASLPLQYLRPGVLRIVEVMIGVAVPRRVPQGEGAAARLGGGALGPGTGRHDCCAAPVALPGRRGPVRAGLLPLPQGAPAPPQAAAYGGHGRLAAPPPEQPLLRPPSRVLGGLIGGRWRLPRMLPRVLQSVVLAGVGGGGGQHCCKRGGPCPLPAPRNVATRGGHVGRRRAHHERRLVGPPTHPRSGGGQVAVVYAVVRRLTGGFEECTAAQLQATGGGRGRGSAPAFGPPPPPPPPPPCRGAAANRGAAAPEAATKVPGRTDDDAGSSEWYAGLPTGVLGSARGRCDSRQQGVGGAGARTLGATAIEASADRGERGALIHL